MSDDSASASATDDHGGGPAPDRQMSETELAAEQARSRAAAYVGLLAVILLGATFVFSALFARTLDGRADSVSRLLATDEHAWLWVVQGMCYAVASALTGLFLAHLALALRSRRPALPKPLPLLAIAGPVIVALSMPLYVIANVSAAGDFADSGVHTAKAATELLSGGFYTGTQYAVSFGLFASALAWLVVSTYCIRAGLLTTLTGVVGAAIGALNLIGATYATPLGLATLIEVFWLGSVSIMLVSNPSQKPPAWPAGEIVTWQEVRRAAAERADESAAD